MAAHVFDATEPTLDSTPKRPAGARKTAAAAPMTDGPMFAAQPAVFHKLQQPTRVGAGPLIGSAVGAVLVGGLVFAMSQHNQGANGATSGVHTLSQPPAATAAAATPAPSPASGAANPAPAPAAAPAPHHLRIVTAPPPRPARIDRPVRARVTARTTAPTAATPDAVTPPAPLTVTPSPTVAPPAQAVTPAPAPSIAAPATQPAPAPSPAPTTTPSTSPDASASSGQPTPQ